MSNKEDFCGACAVIPLSIIGVTAGAYTSNSRKYKKTQTKIIFWSSIVTIIISIIVIIIYSCIKNCSDCK